MIDKTVIQAATKGDEKAFKAIFDFFVPKMRPVALRYAHTTAEGKDILQDAFVKIFNNLSKYKFEGSFEGWVRRIVVNTAIKHYHKSSNQFLFTQIDGLEEDISDSTDEVDLEDEEPSTILNIVQTLPDGYRMVVNLYVLEEYSHREIAEMLHISEGTSRSQYSKAKKMILKLLARQRK